MLAVLTAIALFLCWQMVTPFLPAFTWALALSVAVHPIRSRLMAHFPRTFAATLTVFIALVVLAVPGILLVRELIAESTSGIAALRSTVDLSAWRHAAESNRFLQPLLAALGRLDVEANDIGRELAKRLGSLLTPALTRSVWVLSQVATFLFAFFFFVKDQESMIEAIQSRLPLRSSESDYLFERITDAIHAAVYGRVLIGSLQGFLGGLIFLFVGLPAPVFWGAVMALLSTLPAVGAFLIWAPAAGFLVTQGHWVRALVVVGWGMIVIHPVDNVLYPVLVGAKLGLHPLLLFVAFVGGLLAFGAPGLILGPAVLALAIGLGEIWTRPAITVAG
jgi:predicted PurR-regulated permease PerM